MIRSVLVANRGEIARRIFRTCRARGLSTVAVFSDPDASAPHVREADAAVRLPGAAPGDTYLRGDLIVAAARAAGAGAVHPGYGFLSENGDFARAVLDAGLTWIGPPPDAIDAMADKIAAKTLMRAAGVPVLDELFPDGDLTFPVLVKAAAGGGGRGMRVVHGHADLAAAIESARAEAAAAFGDPTVFCERYLPRGRHLEVQVLADAHGTIWTVGERECSIQRRHQKVIEEAPSPLAERIPGLRERLFAAARLATEAIDYRGAGTVEFLTDERGEFYFLEMNTRLQVEHPVTEETTGLDLVGCQLDIVDGLPLAVNPPPTRGHSVEARLYAEDPQQDWQPQAGTLHRIELAGVRVDSGVEAGSIISPHYDALLAKAISHAPTRAAAASRLAGALERARLHGVATNRDLLVNVLRSRVFLAGDTDTAALDDECLRVPRADPLAPLAAALADAAAARAASDLPEIPPGWRNVRSQPRRREYVGQVVEYGEAVSVTPHRVVLDDDGVQRAFDVARYPGLVCVDSPLGSAALVPVDRFPAPRTAVVPGSLRAPLPGIVARIAVATGDIVTAGQPLLWLEAMKMEHPVTAPAAGIVTELPVRAGQQVEPGTVLAVVEEVP